MSEVTRQPDDESLRTEYQAAQDAWLHHDSLPWQIGALLIAGVFVFWGLVLGNAPQANVLAVASAVIAILMGVWLLYAEAARQIYLCKLHRAREIEELLGMEQHRRFDKHANTRLHYQYFGPSGYTLNAVIFLVTVIGGPIIGIMQVGWTWWWSGTLVVAVATLAWVQWSDSRLLALLATQPKPSEDDAP